MRVTSRLPCLLRLLSAPKSLFIPCLGAFWKSKQNPKVGGKRGPGWDLLVQNQGFWAEYGGGLNSPSLVGPVFPEAFSKGKSWENTFGTRMSMVSHQRSQIDFFSGGFKSIQKQTPQTTKTKFKINSLINHNKMYNNMYSNEAAETTISLWGIQSIWINSNKWKMKRERRQAPNQIRTLPRFLN